MDLNTITEVVRPTQRDRLPAWRTGDALLAGGTWLFSEPQPHLSRLIDLTSLNWPTIEIDTSGVEPMAQVLYASAESATLRADLPAPALGNREALANAPQPGAGYYKVPKVIER